MLEQVIILSVIMGVVYAILSFFVIFPFLHIRWQIVITPVLLLLFYRMFYYSPWVPKEEFEDSRDGKKYKGVKIGEQTWITENLNYDAEGSKCYEDSIANCEKYGRLYEWKTAMKACPSGWHLPSKEEWEALSQFINEPSCSSISCNKTAKFLKAVSGWGLLHNGDDKVGFAALPGGEKTGSKYNNGFESVGDYGSWWSATKYYYLYMSLHHDFASSGNSGDHVFRSVRCIKDN